jgi:hypothetical protein
MRTRERVSRMSGRAEALFATIVAGGRRPHNLLQHQLMEETSAVQSGEKFEHHAHHFLRLLHEGNVAGTRHDDEFSAGNAGGDQIAQLLGDEM